MSPLHTLLEQSSYPPVSVTLTRHTPGPSMSHTVWRMVHESLNQWSSWIGTRWGYRGARKTNDSNDPKVWWRISWRKKRKFIKLSVLFFQLLSKLKYNVDNSTQHFTEHRNFICFKWSRLRSESIIRRHVCRGDFICSKKLQTIDMKLCVQWEN